MTMITNAPVTLNELVAKRHLTILGETVFQELQHFSDASGEPAVLNTLTAHDALGQQHSDFYVPCLLPFQTFTTAQELFNASLPVIRVTVRYAEQHEIETCPAVIFASEPHNAQLLQTCIPKLKGVPIAPRYPTLTDIAGKVVYGNLPMNLAIHAAAIVTTNITPGEGGSVNIELHPPVVVLPM